MLSFILSMEVYLWAEEGGGTKIRRLHLKLAKIREQEVFLAILIEQIVKGNVKFGVFTCTGTNVAVNHEHFI